MIPIIHEIQARSAINQVQGMPFKWSLNPYKGCVHACSYCYARAYHAYVGLPASSFETQLFAKVNIAEVLRAELRRPSWRGEHIAVGTATDPYQRYESQYRLTRQCLEAMATFDNPGSVTTKGTLVTRDIDVMSDLAARADFSVNISLISLDRELLRTLEPGTPAPSSRLRAMERISSAGIRVAVSLAPIIPGMTDQPDQIESVVRAAAEHGATDVWAGALRLAPDVKEHFMRTIEQHFPHLLPTYQRLYGGGAYTPTAYQLRVESLVSARRRAEGMQIPPRESTIQNASTRGQLALPI